MEPFEILEASKIKSNRRTCLVPTFLNKLEQSIQRRFHRLHSSTPAQRLQRERSFLNHVLQIFVPTPAAVLMLCTGEKVGRAPANLLRNHYSQFAEFVQCNENLRGAINWILVVMAIFVTKPQRNKSTVTSLNPFQKTHRANRGAMDALSHLWINLGRPHMECAERMRGQLGSAAIERERSPA